MNCSIGRVGHLGFETTFEGLCIGFTKIGIGKTVSAIILEILVLDKLTLLFIGIEKIIVGEKDFGIVNNLVLIHSLNRHLIQTKYC